MANLYDFDHNPTDFYNYIQYLIFYAQFCECDINDIYMPSFVYVNVCMWLIKCLWACICY